MLDIAVIGGGPAGLSAAVNARARAKSVTVFTSDYRRSWLYRAERIDNYLGLPGMPGARMADSFYTHAREMGASIRQARVTNIMPYGGAFMVGFGSEMMEASAVILALGTAPAAGIPGEASFLGRGVSYCATCDGMLYRGKAVAVLLESPEAIEDANFLHSIGCDVTAIRLPKSVPADGLHEGIDTQNARTVAVTGDDRVRAVELDGRPLEIDALFIVRDAMAPAALLPGLGIQNGFITVDSDMHTSIPGVFAAGDCTGRPLQIARAVGQGQVAALSAVRYLTELARDRAASEELLQKI